MARTDFGTKEYRLAKYNLPGLTMLGKVGHLVSFACLLLLSAPLGRAQNSTDPGGNYTSEVEQKENEDDIKVYDEEGNLVTTSFFFLSDGFEIEKPEDRQVCFVKETTDNGTCFEERPVTSQLPDGIWEKCDGREVLLLKPADCDQDPETEDNGSDVGDGDRKKRSMSYSRCCLWKRTLVTYCGSTYCCRRGFWGGCSRRCCSRYYIRTSWSYKCHYGYTYRYWG